MKSNLMAPAICLMSLLVACGGDPGATTERTNEQLQENQEEMAKAAESNAEWNKERDEAAKELRDLREDLLRKKAGEQKRLADGIKDATKKAECEARIAELDNNIARIDASLIRVETSTTTDWQDVKRSARETVDTAQSWIKREAEKIDWKTDADADKDGH